MATLLAWLFTAQAFADGKVFPAIAFPADVKIPDQSALLIWSNGVERLVIETRFIGEGTNFAWVVPLPSVPEIEPATAGLFPTLRYCLLPELRHNVYSWWAVAVFVCGLVWLLATVRRDQPRRGTDLLACLLTAGGFAASFPSTEAAVFGGPLLFFLLLTVSNSVRDGKERLYAFLIAVAAVMILSAMLLPALAKAGVAAAGGNNSVQVLDRKIVGVFDTTTITARKSDALIDWLKDNGFAVAAEAKPVIGDHVRDGWVFVATKVHRDASSTAPATPHPLSFTFKTAKPIYPLRLTGVGSSGLAVELFVVGSERARIDGFEVTECRQIEPATYGPQWQNRGFPKLKHAQFMAWAGDATVLTRLEARLDGTAMKQDAKLDWEPFASVRSRLYSKQGAALTAANWTVPVAALAVLLAVYFSHKKRLPPSHAAIYSLLGLAAAAGAAFVIYITLPKVAVRLQKMPAYIARSNLLTAVMAGADSQPTNQPVTMNSVRKAITDFISTADARATENPLLGGKIREEDSPGNYTLRETAEGVEIIGYDTTGAPVTLDVIGKPEGGR